MKYGVSPDALCGTFIVPAAVADKYLKLATPLQLRVLIFVFRHLSEGINPEKAAEFLKTDISEVTDALEFWVQVGVLTGEKPAESESAQEKPKAPRPELPSRAEVIKRGMEDKNVTLLMREAQSCFGGAISQNVSSFLLYLYDDCGMDTSVILFLLSYAARKEKCNLSFIRQTANEWLKAGVETVNDAENKIAESAKADLAWSIVERAFGIEKRKPSEKERTLSSLWINEWKISEEQLKAAYDACVDTKSKFIFSYTAKIIEAWHKEGFKKAEDKTADKKKSSKYSYGGFDIDKFDKMLNDDD